VRRRSGAPTGDSLDFAEIALLELRVVKIIEVVEGPDAMAIAEEAFANVRADEARAAGDEKIHVQTLTISGQGVECEGWVGHVNLCALDLAHGGLQF
jgi:hypothetical protein